MHRTGRHICKLESLEGLLDFMQHSNTFLLWLQVTGGAGFVGSHLVDRLMMEGHEVIVVDNFFTGRRRNVEHWVGHENFELIHHDIVNPLYIEVDQVLYNTVCYWSDIWKHMEVHVLLSVCITNLSLIMIVTTDLPPGKSCISSTLYAQPCQDHQDQHCRHH